jgi:NAD(P)-dependent dehydrogenase (short-subunit alcohol dehydrogenase family)
MKNTKWDAQHIGSQSGRRFVVTGGNSGIGWHTALELARAGGDVTLTARTAEKGEKAVERIRHDVPNAKVTAEILDLASLRSIREFTARVGQQPLDVLVNNAGVMAIPTRTLTADGFETQFGTNYLGPFALTALLLPALLRGNAPRVVTVSSGVARQAKIEFDNLQSERRYKPMFGTYSQSKLADLIFAMELQRRAGTRLMSTAAHPGYAVTNLQTNEIDTMSWIMTRLTKPILSQDAAHGALPTLYAAVAAEARPAGFYGPDRMMEMKGNPVEVPLPKQALDVDMAKRLWNVSEELTGIRFEGL